MQARHVYLVPFPPHPPLFQNPFPKPLYSELSDSPTPPIEVFPYDRTFSLRSVDIAILRFPSIATCTTKRDRDNLPPNQSLDLE